MSRIYYPQARVVLNVVFDGFGPTAKDTPPKIIPTLPTELNISRNAYNQADGWEVTFDADDLPIDPRMVRARWMNSRWGTIPWWLAYSMITA